MPDVHVKENTKKQQLKAWLNKNMRIQMTDGRVLQGMFIILNMCTVQ